MCSTRLLVSAFVGLVGPIACSGNNGNHTAGTRGNDGGGGAVGSGGTAGDGRFFVPENLPNTPKEGEVGVTLKLVAFTLLQGAAGPELYAAVRNDGSAPSCNAGMMTDFIDKTGQNVATAATGLRSKQLYRLDATTILGCIDPGQIAMSASTKLPAEVVIAELGSLQHSFPTFGVDGIVPSAGFTVSHVQLIEQLIGVGAGTLYRGTFTNGLDATVNAPNVTIFPVNRVGRPLGVATASATIDVLPAGTWSFETSTVSDVGVDYDAYPAAASVSN
jgi:hypothetical protein